MATFPARLCMPAVLGTAGLLLLVGCSQEREPSARVEKKAPATAEKDGHACCCDLPSAKTLATAKTVEPAAPSTEPVEMKVVKYEQLVDAIKANKGKIVVVDIWATTCVPCKKEFPQLVDLHRRHGRDGVVCTSVCVDLTSGSDPKDQESALTFLKSKGATFANYYLNEEYDYWADRWKIKGVPVVFVFGRDGQIAKRFDNDDPDNQFTYEDVNKVVDMLLAQP